MHEFRKEMAFGVRINPVNGAIVIYHLAGELDPYELSLNESIMLRSWLEEAEEAFIEG